MIGFLVIRRYVTPNLLHASEAVLGQLVNNLSSELSYFGTVTTTLETIEVSDIKSWSQDQPLLQSMNALCASFLSSKLEYLLILQDHLWLSQDFVRSIYSLISETDLNDKVAILTPPNTLGTSASILHRSDVISLIRYFDEHSRNSSSDAKHVKFKTVECYGLYPNKISYFLDVFENQSNSLRQIETFLLDPILEHSMNLSVTPKKAKVKVVVIHWFATWHNIFRIEESLIHLKVPFTILNCTSVDIKRENWIPVRSISFFSSMEQICSFDYCGFDYFLLICADVVNPDWNSWFTSTLPLLDGQNVGTLSPSLSWDHFSAGIWGSRNSVRQFRSSYILPANDLICTYINSQVIEVLQDFFVFFRQHSRAFEPKVGWCLCHLVANICQMRKLIAVKLRDPVLVHPSTSSYSKETAAEEASTLNQICHDFLISRYGIGLQEVTALRL